MQTVPVCRRLRKTVFAGTPVCRTTLKRQLSQITVCRRRGMYATAFPVSSGKHVLLQDMPVSWKMHIMAASGKLLTKNGENYGGGKIENVDLHPTPPYTPGPGTRALGYRGGGVQVHIFWGMGGVG